MSSGSARLPRLNELGDRAARRVCLERFAHHELMAVELFAWALVTWPDLPPELRLRYVQVLEEEQRHLRLYLERLEAHGGGLGEGRLSGYFWRHVAGIRDGGPVAFLCAMGLTFEQANLDFAGIYRDAFRRAGDEESARATSEVRRDEIGHVRLAIEWLRRLKEPAERDFDAYRRAVPFPLSAARAKGRRFDVDARRQAGLDEEFIAAVRAARPSDDRRDHSS